MFTQILPEKTALVIATFVGMAMCSVGIGQVAARGEWTHPLSIISYGLGALILIIAGAGIFDMKLPFIDSTRAALISVIVLAIAEMLLTQLHRAIA
ncbi:MAG TPA: hypothetical protein VFD70_03645 [Anaerolineae bacterium]|nr:hypothetical protein [Anaerolineae bacterium]